MIKDSLAAERYARAVFELARGLSQDEAVEAELENFSQALVKNPALESFMNNPHLASIKKKQMLERLYPKDKNSYNAILVNLFCLLFSKGRFGLIHEVSAAFKRVADEYQGQATATLVSAVALDAQQESELKTRIEKLAGYKICLKKKVDPSIIGGAVIHFNNKTIDGSVRFKIDNLHKQLISERVL